MDLKSPARHALIALATLALFVAGAAVSGAPASAAPGTLAAAARTDGTATKKKGVKKPRRTKAEKKAGEKRPETLGDKDFYVYEHIIVRGDTVGKLAARFGVAQEQILVWNDLQSPHLIRVGKTLVVYSKKKFPQYERGHYEVRPGDTLGKIARRYKMRVSQIRALNRLRGDLIRPGQDLVVLELKKPDVAKLGGRSEGKLSDAIQLSSGAGYHVRDPKEAWGTVSTVRQLKRAFRVMRKTYKKSVAAIGDISKKGGGPLAGHRSHQRGLDVDLSFYRRGVTVHKEMRKESPRTLDAKRTWALLDAFLAGGQVDMVFIDYALQKPLYEEALRVGVSKSKAADIFQYPRGKRARRGTVRHEPGHDDHIHVRFLDMPTRAVRATRQGRTSGASK